MTDTELNVETLAQRIAARGRDALVERLRVAYSDAAAVHADIVSLDDERIETLVQSAAARADGLQWRRALAGVAAKELDLSLPEALSHPAVARAQTLVGAPSYEQGLAELIARPVSPASANGGEPEGAPAGAPTSAAAPADDQLELAPEPVELESKPVELESKPVELETELYEAQPEPSEQDALPALEPGPFTEPALSADAVSPEEEALSAESSSEEDLHVMAVHLGGVANLPTHKEGLGLTLSGNGLDIMEGDGEIIGRLVWDEIDALEVPHVRARRRRQQTPRARLVVRTPHGDASFEIPGFEGDELRDRIEPLISRYGRH